MSSYSRYDDRRRDSSSRRESSSSSSYRRDRDSGRRSSPGPSRGRSPPPTITPRDENELPVEFGRPLEPTSKEDENTVLRRMRTAFTHSPLNVINKCISNNVKVKIWTRNFKEVRGVCTGYVVAFDKHWNLILSDVIEVYLKPKKAKTPFLLDPRTCDELAELPPKVPRVKKTKTPEEIAAEEELAKQAAAKKAAKQAAAKKAADEAAAKKTDNGAEDTMGDNEAADKEPKKKRKNSRKINERHLKQLFVRGDNIVMCAVLDDEPDSEQSE